MAAILSDMGVSDGGCAWYSDELDSICKRALEESTGMELSPVNLGVANSQLVVVCKFL